MRSACILHFSYNPNCYPAAFLANFATKDPGTQTMWSSLFTVPSFMLNAASGLSEDDIDRIKRLPVVVAPGTGGTECLRRCGLDFNTVRNTVALRRGLTREEGGGRERERERVRER